MADRPEETGGASPSVFSERGWVVAAGLLLVLVVGAVVLLFTSRGGGQSNPATHAVSSGAGGPGSGASGAATTTATATDPDASICGLPAGDQEIPATPPDAHWTHVGQLEAPNGAPGPGSTAGGIRSCYAHSPTGALFAATNFLAAESGAVGEHAQERLLPLFAVTPALEEAEAQPAGTCHENSAGTEELQLAGFRITASNADEVTVELALYGYSAEGKRAIAGMSLPMRWEDGDWKFVLTSAACDSDPYNTTGLENISGYVPWGGA